MASTTTHGLLLSTALLLAAVAAAAAVRSPGYCVPGQAIPRSPLPSCRLYAASRTCGAMAMLPSWYLRDMCCRELQAMPAECRCKALRVMVEETPLGEEAGFGQTCWLSQAQFAPAVVTECGMRTIHGAAFCYPLGAED